MTQKIAFACLVTSFALPTFAQTEVHATTPTSAYTQDARGNIARNGFGQCWRSGYWIPADSVPGCDGELLMPIAKPITPEVVAAATPMTPMLTPAPKPAALKRCDFAITLQSDETFDFNKTLLKNGAKQRIDKGAMEKLATCAKLDLVIVTGHTDLIGDHKYNQKLSEKRADAVASYLAGKGVSAPIDTMGMGKTQQIKFCDEKLSQTKLFDCLAPNRRVVIEGRGLAK